MTRFMPLLVCVLLCALVAVPASADDPPKKLTPEERKALEAKWKETNAKGMKAYQNGKYPDAIVAFDEGLKVAQQLYPKTEFADGHADLATALNNLAFLYEAQREYAAAEPLLKDALGMRRRLFKGDHPDVATSLHTLGHLYYARGNPAAAEPLFREALDMCKRLFKGDHPEVSKSLNNLAFLYYAQDKHAAAEPLFREALGMLRRLFKGDHPDVARGLNNLAFLYLVQGKYAAAEPLLKDALGMLSRLFEGDRPEVARGLSSLGHVHQAQGNPAAAEPLLKDALGMLRRLFKGDHPDVAKSLNNLASLYQAQGRYAAAEPLYNEALEMHKRLHKGDHAAVAASLNNLGGLHSAQDKHAAAEPLFREALGMRRRLFKGDHPDVAQSLNTLGGLYSAQGNPAAEPLLKDALGMRRRLFKGDHPDVAASLNTLSFLYYAQGNPAAAEPLLKDALGMRRRLFKGDHPDTVPPLHNLAVLYQAQGRYAAAEPLYADALGMCRRLMTQLALDKSEGETLSFSASLAPARDAFLANARERGADSVTIYPQVWADKGFIARVYEGRQRQARAASDPKAAMLFAELSGTRRLRAELVLAPATKDPDTRTKRDDDIRKYEERIDALTRELNPLLPAVERADKLAAARPAELQQALPAGAAVVDFLRYTHVAFDKDKPGKAGETRTKRYLAFVITKDKLAWVDLDTAADIEPAVDSWRDAITGGKEIPDAIPAKVRALVWEKVRKELPAGTTTVYVCPDEVLCRVPFAALPGDKPGTVLLEDFALATIPHAPFLLDKLLPQDPLKNPPTAARVVGGVKYDAAASLAGANASAPLLAADEKRVWGFLPNTVGEANGVVAAAAKKNHTPARLDGDKATPAAVLAALPKAKVAHFATHGFFSDASFRSALQLDEKDYEKTLRGERVGRAASSPLVMTGLVFAGANDPKAAGRGIVTGESLIDLDLSGLELAVLSACETGVGDTAGGQGTFGLQRAFHYAGTTNVVASLWKVPDRSTAALMALFYQNLWERNLSPMESLRQAQLEVYRNPGKVAELAEGFRGKFAEVPGAAGERDVTPPKDGKAHPLLWAAFTLSGPGR